jgi:AcrR family transcriptional regulator
VGIGTLYRHFPTRQDLFDTVYLDEVEALCRSSDELGDLPAWDAFVSWADHLVAYVSTKRALAEALNHNSEMFQHGREAVVSARLRRCCCRCGRYGTVTSAAAPLSGMGRGPGGRVLSQAA